MCMEELRAHENETKDLIKYRNTNKCKYVRK